MLTHNDGYSALLIASAFPWANITTGLNSLLLAPELINGKILEKNIRLINWLCILIMRVRVILKSTVVCDPECHFEDLIVFFIRASKDLPTLSLPGVAKT